jgi:hypothetical protein
MSARANGSLPWKTGATSPAPANWARRPVTRRCAAASNSLVTHASNRPLTPGAIPPNRFPTQPNNICGTQQPRLIKFTRPQFRNLIVR